MTVAPIDLYASFIRLHRGGRVSVAPQRFDSDGDEWRVMTFHVETDGDVHADHWERHPEADEAVSCLTGAVRVYLRPEQPGATEEEEIQLAAGAAMIVPRGRWHRIALDCPSDIMSITFPRGSQLERRVAP